MKRRIFRFLDGLLFLCIIIMCHFPSQCIRRLFYGVLRLKVGRKSVIYYGSQITHPWMVSIGHSSVIGQQAMIDGRSGVRIGNNVNISTGVWVWTMEHDHRDPMFGVKGGPVVIDDFAWVSCRATILPNVWIGKGAVVCAGAVVTHDVPEYSIVAGVPARTIGERTKDLRYCLSDDPPLPFI